MNRIQSVTPARGTLLLLFVFINAIVLKEGLVTNSQWYTALLFTAPLLGIAVIDTVVRKKNKEETMHDLLDYFSEEGIRNNLKFSGQEVLKNCIIGLDGVNRKLLIVIKKNGVLKAHVLSLDDVQQVSVKKIYYSIGALELKHKKLEQFIQKILLCFECKDKESNLDVLFYDGLNNKTHKAPELEDKALGWKSVLSKMLPARPVF